MTKIAYDNDAWGNNALKWMRDKVKPLEAVAIANDILLDYQGQGYTLTLRQLYYQFVGRGLTSENTERAYKNLGTLMTKARNNGLISWFGIEDRGRALSGLRRHEEDDNQVVRGLEGLLSIDRWARQDAYVEVWVEKDALSNVISRACYPLQTPFMATKGYLSASEAWRAGQRFQAARDAGKHCVMIHLGDHDPEGIDMTRDNGDRLFKYSNFKDVEVRRIALNMDQVEEYNPPPNYAKASSSRFESYVKRFGDQCWELDALEPSVMVKLITHEIRQFIDLTKWQRCRDLEEKKRHYLEILADHWDGVKGYLDEQD